jgi:ubiquinone/menaquinone biosynthesis C-methylase UbiE
MDKRLANEIAHGKYLIDHDPGEVWNWETPAGKKRWARRAEMLTRLLAAGTKVLEIGCGTGYFSKEIVRTGADITAIDISPDLLSVAAKKLTANNIVFKVENAYAMSFENNSFDFIIGSSVLHHLDVKQALLECRRTLKPGGTLRFTEPNMLNPQIALQKNIPFIKKRMGESPDETAFFRWSLKKHLEEAGFVDISIHPFDFLHPQIPKDLIKYLLTVCSFLERTPILSEFAGSLYIEARKKGKESSSSKIWD